MKPSSGYFTVPDPDHPGQTLSFVYYTGSSVFPTVATGNPFLTIAALAFWARNYDGGDRLQKAVGTHANKKQKKQKTKTRQNDASTR